MYNIYTMSEVLSSPDDDFDKIVSGITPSWEKEDDDISVPEQCKYCPIAMAALRKFNEYKKAVGELLRMASAEEEIVVVNMLTGERLSKGATDRVCEITGKKLNELDKIKEEIVRLTNGCEGLFVLIGSDGRRRTVSAATCGSDEMFKSGLDPQYELVRVQRYQEGNKD